MPQVTAGAGAALAALLLALAACGQAPTAPPPPAGNDDALAPVSGQTATPPAVPAPGQGMSQAGAAPEPDEGDGPSERFVICPGNPRCPPADGNQPKGARDQ